MGERDRFLVYLQSELGRSPLTVRAYGDDLQAFACYMEQSEGGAIETATLADCRSYMMVMIERGDNPRSVNRRITALRVFYDFLIRSGLRADNPTARIQSLRTAKNLPKYVPEAQSERLVERLLAEPENFAARRDALVLLLLYFCGLRRAEVATLTLDHVDLAARTIRVVGKGQKERIVPLVEPLAECLERYLEECRSYICQNEQKFVLLDDQYRPLGANRIYTLVRRVLGEAGVDGQKSPHVLRHTFATHLLSRGAPIKTIADLLGHASIATTQIYSHVSVDLLKESYRKAHPRANEQEEEEELRNIKK